MVSKFKKPFNLSHLNKTSCEGSSSSSSSSVAVGLGILTQISQQNSNIIVMKSALLRSSHPHQPTTSIEISSCFLKTCYLCNKGLSLDKEVYMYRGDLGFCSIECRNRQIVIDDMKELEASTKQMIESYRRGGQYRCSSSSISGRDSPRVLEDGHRQQERIPHRHRNIFAL